MPYIVSIDQARAEHKDYTFVNALTPSSHKAAFHVRDKGGRDLCLKMISPTYSMDRLGREIEALQSLDHPNIVKLLSYTYTSSPTVRQHYMLEEFVEGTDLADQLTGSPWSVDRIVGFFSQLCDGLSALQRAQVVHRDLKPDNIRVRPDGSPVIIDFGVSRLLARDDLTYTHQGAAIGTRKYFSPEQCRGTKHDIDHRTDLFALGILLHEAAMGVHPFMGKPSLTDAICSFKIDFDSAPYARLPRLLRQAMRKLLEKKRVDRFTHAGIAKKIIQNAGATK